MTGERVVELLDEFGAAVRPQSPIRVVWLTVLEHREELCHQIRAARAHRHLYPLVLRDALFTNPNAVMRDVLALLEEKKTEILDDYEKPLDVCLLVLAKHELGVPQQSSMVPAPEWLPDIGGQLVSIPVDDLTWNSEVGLDAPEANVNELKQALFELESQLLRRIQANYDINPEPGNRLWDSIRLRKDRFSSMAELLTASVVARERTSAPSSFRPGMGDGIVGRLVSAVGQTGPARLDGLAVTLADALGWDASVKPRERCILSVLLTAPGRQAENRTRAAKGLLWLAYGLFRWVAASGHADLFDLLPVRVIAVSSQHLRTAAYEVSRDLRMA